MMLTQDAYDLILKEFNKGQEAHPKIDSRNNLITRLNARFDQLVRSHNDDPSDTGNIKVLHHAAALAGIALRGLCELDQEPHAASA